MKKIKTALKWNDDNVFIKIFQTLRTFIIVLFGEVMFRAHSLSDAFVIYKKIFTTTRINASSLMASLTPFGNGNQAAASVIILSVLLAALFTVELLKEKNENAFTGHRYIYATGMLIVMVLFGVAGQSNFMYQAF